MNFSSLLVLLWIFRRAERGQDPDRPDIVSTNRKSKAVLDRAKQLADEGREDVQAIFELRALAGNRRRNLRQAERASRFMGLHRELARANLTNRLLRAALRGDTVPAATTERDRKRIEAVEGFNAEGRVEQWAHLTRLQPGLLELAADVRAGRFGEITTRDGPPFTSEETQQLLNRASGLEELRSRLATLVGPSCAHEDLLLGSQRALAVANAHLLRTAA
ncbi:MAG TPA: hypothetical protein VH061_02095 [Solirubrobacteraceae bacterium]|nr:hypothetical protein [Solirubrobacteraceae bacterium]